MTFFDFSVQNALGKTSKTLTNLSKLSLAMAISLPMVSWAYTLSITSPSEPESAYQRPAQSVEVAVDVSPAPTGLHTVVIRLDGNVVATNSKQATIATLDYDPGQHILTAELQDMTGAVVASDSRTLYFIQNNNLIKEQKAKQAQIAAYNALPWYKKAYAKLTDQVPSDKPTPTGTMQTGYSGTTSVSPSTGTPTGVKGYGTTVGFGSMTTGFSNQTSQ